MRRIAIVADGQFPRTAYPAYLLQQASCIVCCDGALSALEKRGIVPDIVIGDLDSVCHRALGRFKGTVVHDSDQETNDLTKAFKYCLEHFPDADDIVLIAATGKSEAHTVANLSLLMQYEKDFHLSERGVNVQMVSDYSTIFALTDSSSFQVGEGRKVSIFSPDPSLRIKSEGLRWSTDDVVFDNWWKASLNRSCSDTVKLTFSHPAMALIILD